MGPSDIDEGEEWRNAQWASWCYGCFLFGRTAQRLEKFPDTNTDHFNDVNVPCAVLYAAWHVHLGWMAVMLKRQDLRQKFGIKSCFADRCAASPPHGNAYTDCLASYCCQPCTLAQMEAELQDRAATAEVVSDTHTQETGYVPRPQGMLYSPPTGPAPKTRGFSYDNAVPGMAPEIQSQGQRLPAGTTSFATEVPEKEGKAVATAIGQAI
ncbi:hypothetical protein LTR85_000383 [Meristemomyces frigidus]|nr:hypothetical protein LTR85_000383 [Meristemomyces frigidus]